MKVTDVSFHKIVKKNLRAFAKITFDDAIVVTGARIMDGSNGLFMAWPSKFNEKDDKWYETVFATNKDSRQEINDEVIRLYRDFIGEKEEPVEDSEEGSTEDPEDDDLPF